MSFTKIIENTLAHEGGYVDHPNDKGGETNFGITKRRYPDEDIRNLTLDRAKYLYERDFWLHYRLEIIPSTYQHIYFDMLVNHGPRGSAKIMQRAVNTAGGTLTVDGVFGDESRRQLCIYMPNLYAIRFFRMSYYHDIVKNNPDQVIFLMGWLNRARKV